MARKFSEGHRDVKEKRGTSVRGNLCPGIWVEDPQVTLGRNTRRLLKKWERNGIGLMEFSRLSGVSTTVLQDVRAMRSWPEPGTLMKLASTFGVPIEVLFRR